MSHVGHVCGHRQLDAILMSRVGPSNVCSELQHAAIFMRSGRRRQRLLRTSGILVLTICIETPEGLGSVIASQKWDTLMKLSHA